MWWSLMIHQLPNKHKSLDSDEDDEEPQKWTRNLFLPPNLLYQCYLWIKGQQPVHRDQLPAPILMTQTVSIATSTVHEVRTPERQCSKQISLSWLKIKHWTVTPEVHKVCTRSWVMLFRDNGKRRRTRCLQLDTFPWCSDHCALMNSPTIPAAHNLNYRSELTVKPKTCWNVAWPLVEKPQEQEEIPCTKGSVSPRSTRIPQTVCWSETLRVEILDWQKGLWPRWLDEDQPEEQSDRTTPTTSRPTSKATSSGRRPDGPKEDSRTNKKHYRQILLLPQDLDFGWVHRWQPAKVGIFSTLISKQLFFKDRLMMWIVIL